MINRNKFFLILLFLLIIAIPVSFASDNATGEINVDILETVETGNISVNDDGEILGANDVYFDASASSDGDGSQSNPYKTVSASRLGTNNHFKPGTYTLTSGITTSIFSSNAVSSFSGEDMEKTIIRFTGTDNFLSTSSDVSFSKITLIGANIVSTGGTITATDTIFDSGVAKEETESDNYKYGNSYGGAIKQAITSSSSIDWGDIFGGGSSSSAGMTFNNCVFKNNYAAYGGAIYAEKGTVTITNSRFEKNHADNGGGAIAALNSVKLTITDCVFEDDYSSYDAGGAVYLFNVTSASIKNTQFNDCQSAIGGAVASLISPVTVTGSNFNRNRAGWNGGAIFSMYGSLSVTSSDFHSNSAYNGGAIYADNLTNLEVNGGVFEKNTANSSAGAIFAFTNKINKITNPTYISNQASYQNDLYQTDRIELILGSEDYEMIQYKPSYAGTLPSKYDLRSLNLVTPVKDQGLSGNCWSFATMATLESAILKATGKQVILSEGNLKNLANIYSDIGWKFETNNGGMYPFAFGYLTSWAGPVLAELDPTDDWDVIAPILNSAVHVQNILFLQRTSFTDNNAIKKAIMDYGAVCSEIYWSTSYLNGNNYYYSGSESRNHAISVVGWDDTRTISGAPGAGAWIIKNSYGSHRGEGGYYYVSYYDKSLFRVYDESYNSFAVIFNDTLRFNRNYQYDAAFTDYFMTSTMNKQMWYKNTFTSAGNDILSAFSTYFRKVTNWQAQIFVNGELKTTQEGKSNPGYYTINLNDRIQLNAGDEFTIQLKISCSSSADIPISEAGPDYTLVKEYFKPGVSFFSADGETWTDFYGYKATYGSGDTAHNYMNQVACIKAFTTQGQMEFLNTTIEIMAYNSTSVILKILDQNGGIINTGNVELIIDGNKLISSVSRSLAIVNTYLKPGNHIIQANYIKNDYYNSSSTSQTITMDRETPTVTIIAGNIEYGQDLHVKISVTNIIGQTINVPVTVEINGRKYATNEFDVSGLNPADYTINVQTALTDEYNAKLASKTVTVSKIKPNVILEISDEVIEGENATIKAYLPNDITDTLTLTIDSHTYHSVASNGEATFTVSGLKVGKYSFTVDFTGNDKYYQQSASDEIEVLEKAKSNPTFNVAESVDGNSLIVNVVLPNDATGNVTLTIDSLTFTKVPVDGKASFRINGLANGVHDFTVKYMGDSQYKSALVKKSVTINQTIVPGLTIDAQDSIRAYLSGCDFEATFFDNNGNPLNSKEVLFTVNGNEYYVKTNQYGVAKLSQGFGVATFTVNVFNLITGDNITKSMTIVDRISENKNINMDYNEGSSFRVRVYGDNGHAVGAGEVVSFKVEGKTYKIKTDKNGYATFKITLKPKTYAITTSYRGVSVSNKIVVKQILKAKNISKKKAKRIKFTATLKSSKGKAIVGKKITFKIKGKKYTAKTNKKGKATITLKNLKVGKYKITSTYLKCVFSNTIKIKK